MQGFFLIAAGIGLFIYCTLLFRRIGKGTPAPVEPPKKFVYTGIYRYVRNPIYIAYLTIFLGIFFMLGYVLLLLYPLLSAIVLHLYLVLYEEKELVKRFGRSYEEYMRRVPRWIPKN